MNSHASVTESIGGITFDDPFAWLHEDTVESLAWQDNESEQARHAARSTALYAWIYELNLAHQPHDMAMLTAPRLLGGRWFRRTSAASGDDVVVVGEDLNGPDRTLISAAELTDPGDARRAQIWFFEPSTDGRYCAIAYALGGDTSGFWVVVDADTGERLPVHAPSLLFNSPRPGWLPGDDGFYLAERTESGDHRYVVVGLDGTTTPVIDFDADAVSAHIPALVPQVSRRGTWVAGLSAPHELVVRRLGQIATGRWRAFLPPDYIGECYGDWLDDDTYVAIVTEGAPRGRVVAIPAETSTDRSTWRELVEESAAVLRCLTVLPDHLVLLELRDVSLGIRVIDRANASHDVTLPSHSATMRTLLRMSQRTDQLVIDCQSFTRPAALVAVDCASGTLRPIGAARPELAGIDVEQRFCAAGDGTRLPFYVVQRADLPTDTPLPTLMYAYGGYNAPVLPNYLAHALPFVLAGGRYVVANLRGGGEYGSRWHESGRLHRKQTTFDDLYCVAEELIARGLTTSGQLGFQGFSNGGSTAGIALVQRPDLWRVVVPCAPQFDWMQPVPPGPAADAMRSYATSEYGDPDDPDDAKIIYAISAYHNIRPGLAYPAVFSVFGAIDPGCGPFSGRKFTARLRDATTSGLPVLLRVWPDTGHGAVGDAGAQWDAEWLAFTMDQLGMRPPST